MGSTQAIEFANAAHAGEVDLDAALTWHLRSNHYPPLPLSLLPVARQAINLAQSAEDEQDYSYLQRELELPAGVQYRNGNTCTVEAAMEGWHLWDFVISGTSLISEEN